MAGCSRDSQNVDSDNIQTNLQRSSCCYVCNGYYGSCFDEQICQTCHLFLFSEELTQAVQEDVHNTMGVEDGDSGNDEPADIFYNGFQRPVQDVPLDAREQAAPSQDLARRIQLLSELSALRTQPFDDDSDYFQELPPEVLLTVFSYLDDFSLWCVSKVCTRWNQLLRSHIPQTWRRFVVNCWPLYQPLKPVDDWLSVSSALFASSSCLLCIRRMYYRPHAECQENSWRRRRLRHEVKNLKTDPPEGIRAISLDNHWCHWQATILGPAGSPFEGGKFFLYIQIPYGYPMTPPVVRFLTKIFHPNISRHGDIGIDSLHYNWSLALTIAKVLISIQSLLTDPFCDVCMEPDIARLYNNDRQTYNTIARYWTHRFAMNDILTWTN
ncbi:uncharacterized protein LOC113553411 [Rhopalosiphum maidis]|uniref:uncharacterized protein LOC113553411 n=1 Tax=Rhopalosiphum maidis TaxID=43146 RepID=UPI000F008763|nr:uncharacterized protein LOC113553411 [Rhopalosiphum maidis]